MNRIASPAVVSELLRRRGLHPNRRWGQNFLVDGNLLSKVADAGELAPEDGVLEIGPGLGALTHVLAERVRRVLAVEIDPGLHAALTEETASGLANLTLLHGDFLQTDLDTLIPETLGPGRHVVVANIPYSITSPVVIRLLEHRHLFRRIVLMVQKEVAERLTARPDTSEYGSLTLFANLYSDVRMVATVSRHAFLPAPEVDSAILRFEVLEERRFPDIPERRYTAVVQSAFQMRRKNLGNALTGPSTGWSREQALAALDATGIDFRRRGETLSPDEFAALARHWPEEAPDTRTRLKVK